MSHIEKEKLIKADIASIENRVRHAFNQGYDLGFKDGKSKQPNCSEIPTGSTTKNCRTCRNFDSHHGICEICKDNKCWTEQEPTTKNNIEVEESSGDNVVSRDVVKEQMIMYGFHAPDMTVTEFVEDLPPVNPKEPTTKNDLEVDCISRADVLKLMQDNWHTHNGDWAMQESMDDIRALPSVTPQEPCDKCEVGNPCLYCKHEFEPQESED